MRRKKEIDAGLPATFIVQICRFPSETQRDIMGVVETVGVEGKRDLPTSMNYFRSLLERWIANRKNRNKETEGSFPCRL
jgi:hypothetical protein